MVAEHRQTVLGLGGFLAPAAGRVLPGTGDHIVRSDQPLAKGILQWHTGAVQLDGHVLHAPVVRFREIPLGQRDDLVRLVPVGGGGKPQIPL